MSAAPIDHGELLRKYLHMIYDIEGTTFIGRFWSRGAVKEYGFSKREYEELEKINELVLKRVVK